MLNRKKRRIAKKKAYIEKKQPLKELFPLLHQFLLKQGSKNNSRDFSQKEFTPITRWQYEELFFMDKEALTTESSASPRLAEEIQKRLEFEALKAFGYSQLIKQEINMSKGIIVLSGA